jgi:hypothetical protein
MFDVAQEPVLKRVRSLLAKTEAAGCTPQEAAAASAKVKEIIAKYGLNPILTQPFKSTYIDLPLERLRVRVGLASSITWLTGTRYELEDKETKLRFYGFAPDVDKAIRLLEKCEKHVESCANQERFIERKYDTTWLHESFDERASFERGAVDEISRLLDVISTKRDKVIKEKIHIVVREERARNPKDLSVLLAGQVYRGSKKKADILRKQMVDIAATSYSRPESIGKRWTGRNEYRERGIEIARHLPLRLE